MGTRTKFYMTWPSFHALQFLKGNANREFADQVMGDTSINILMGLMDPVKFMISTSLLTLKS